MKKKPFYSKRFLSINLLFLGCLILVMFWLYMGTVYNTGSIHSSADAVNINAGDAGTINFPGPKYGSIAGLLAGIINWVFGFAGGLALLGIVYSGLMYITSGDDTQKSELARRNLTWAVYGLIIIASSILIVNIVQGMVH